MCRLELVEELSLQIAQQLSVFPHFLDVLRQVSKRLTEK